MGWDLGGGIDGQSVVNCKLSGGRFVCGVCGVGRVEFLQLLIQSFGESAINSTSVEVAAPSRHSP